MLKKKKFKIIVQKLMTQEVVGLVPHIKKLLKIAHPQQKSTLSYKFQTCCKNLEQKLKRNIYFQFGSRRAIPMSYEVW
jgi:hypothetical protein